MPPARSLKLIAFVGGSVLFLLAVFAILMALDARKDAAKAKGDGQLSQGRTTSAVEAITQIGEFGQRADATDAQVKEAHDAIRQAAPADRDRVARYHLCVLHDRPNCDGMLRAGAGNPDH